MALEDFEKDTKIHDYKELKIHYYKEQEVNKNLNYSMHRCPLN